jgi:hypothetical protein
MKYLSQLIIALLFFLLTDCKKNNNSSVHSKPTISITAVSGIGITTAIGEGNIISTAQDSISGVGICLSVQPSPSCISGMLLTPLSGNNYNFSIPFEFHPAVAGIKYYVRAYAENTMHEQFYSNQLVFTSKAFSVGDTLEDGIIFSIFPGQDGGYIAAADDLPSVSWTNGVYNITEASSGSSGNYNTSRIMAALPLTPSDFAAYNCYAYHFDKYSSNRWFLPASEELNLLYSQKDIVGRFSSIPYWSSTEVDSVNAIVLDFSNGQQNKADKVNKYAVRPIKLFY